MKKTDNYLYNYRESGDNRKDILHEREDDDMQRIIIERLSVLEKDVLNSIKNDVQDERADMTISAVARRNFVSQALLVKLAKKMGFSGFRLHFTVENGREAAWTAERFLKIMKGTEQAGELPGGGECTKGHFKRGVE